MKFIKHLSFYMLCFCLFSCAKAPKEQTATYLKENPNASQIKIFVDAENNCYINEKYWSEDALKMLLQAIAKRNIKCKVTLTTDLKSNNPGKIQHILKLVTDSGLYSMGLYRGLSTLKLKI